MLCGAGLWCTAHEDETHPEDAPVVEDEPRRASESRACPPGRLCRTARRVDEWRTYVWADVLPSDAVLARHGRRAAWWVGGGWGVALTRCVEHLEQAREAPRAEGEGVVEDAEELAVDEHEDEAHREHDEHHVGERDRGMHDRHDDHPHGPQHPAVGEEPNGHHDLSEGTKWWRA